MELSCVVSSFDMVNVADLDLLDQVVDRGHTMVVAVLDDALVTQLHGRGPVVPELERLELVKHLRVTDEVVLVRDLDELDARNWTVLTDEQALAPIADHVLVPMRRSSSPELLNALAQGAAA